MKFVDLFFLDPKNPVFSLTLWGIALSRTLTSRNTGAAFAYIAIAAACREIAFLGTRRQVHWSLKTVKSGVLPLVDAARATVARGGLS